MIYLISEYFLRRVREEFRQNRNVQDSSKIAALLKRGQENLQVIRRQVGDQRLFKIKHIYFLGDYRKSL
jgi:hypothetical protein